MKQSGLSILFPRQEEVTYREIPEESWHDLGLDTLTEKIASQPQEVPLLRRVMMSLTADPEVAAFRSDVFEDILRHPEIRERMLKLLDKVKMFYDYGVVNRHEGDEAGIWDLMHRLEEYHDYILTVEAIRECLSEKDLISEGLNTLRDTVDRIYQDQGFAALRRDVEEMRVSASEIRSLTVGINLNDRFEAVSMGLISVNGKPFTRSSLLKNFLTSVTPRDEIRKEADWSGSYTYYPANTEMGLLASVDQVVQKTAVMRNPLAAMSLARIPEADGSANVPRQMDSAASMLTSRIARRLRETLGQYLNISVKEIADLIPELVFYTRWAEYIEKKEQEGWSFCGRSLTRSVRTACVTPLRRCPCEPIPSCQTLCRQTLCLLIRLPRARMPSTCLSTTLPRTPLPSITYTPVPISTVVERSHTRTLSLKPRSLTLPSTAALSMPQVAPTPRAMSWASLSSSKAVTNTSLTASATTSSHARHTFPMSIHSKARAI